jgi:hypothetical protein
MSRSRYQIQKQTGELLIITTNPNDTALFSCNATNSQGSISAEAYLNVYREFIEYFIIRYSVCQDMIGV